VSPVKDIIIRLYNDSFGGITQKVIELSIPECIKAYDFGQKILFLIIGWFAILFIIELLIRILMFTLIKIYQQIFVGKISKNEIVEDSTHEKND
jgi:hypothetical protein